MAELKQRLGRLPAEHYRGLAWVHWNQTIHQRRVGWRSDRFLYRFRELVTHALFRHRVACPIYCLMPDHIHLLWCGLTETSDQRLAMQTLRKTLRDSLRRIGFDLQRQPYDHVLRNDEANSTAIHDVVDYIARNPERQQLVPVDGYETYRYTGCILPGFPLIRLFDQEGWGRIEKTIATLRQTRCLQRPDPRYAPQNN